MSLPHGIPVQSRYQPLPHEIRLQNYNNGRPTEPVRPGLSADYYEPKHATDAFVNPSSLRRGCPLDNHRSHFAKPMVKDSTKLFKLPVETLHACLKHLDIQTLTNLRRVSQYSRSCVDSLFEYSEIIKYAPEAIRALLSVESAHRVPLLRLYDSLTFAGCSLCLRRYVAEHESRTGRKLQEEVAVQAYNEQLWRCGFMGGYLSLFEGVRVCAFCLRNSPFHRICDYSDLVRRYPRHKSQEHAFPPLEDLVTIHTVPGCYGTSSQKKHFRVRDRKRLVLVSAVRARSGKTFGPRELDVVRPHPDIQTYFNPLLEYDRISLWERMLDWNQKPFQRPGEFSYASVVRIPLLLPGLPKASPQPSLVRFSTVNFEGLAAPPPEPRQVPTRGLDHLSFCQTCILRSEFREHLWNQRQTELASSGRSVLASERRRAGLDYARLMAPKQYLDVSSWEMVMDRGLFVSPNTGAIDKTTGSLNARHKRASSKCILQLHLKKHENDKVGDEEKAWIEERVRETARRASAWT